MRKAQKEQVESFIELLGQAQEEIKNYIEENNIQTALKLLEQCQDGAVSLGMLIEKTEGEEFVTVFLLEEYCELIYNIHKKLLEGQSDKADKIYETLSAKLLKIRKSIENDIKIRKEIVFLPYKASMWDSLESVWRKVDDDPDCDAYVIPIPYYDKNQDGSFGEYHYEGNDYPENVPIVWYGDYDFAEHKPDKIYIHNPYDNINFVTSVEPEFYSVNLKKYTEQLIYIPYFILDEIEPDDQIRIDGMKHFIGTPGVINADKVIVQSEKMKQIYVNEYLKFAVKQGLQGKHLDRKYLEKKILGLGSPKVDRILNIKKENLKIPDKWLEIIRKPDGSWKKIVFYNTAISGLLEYGEKWVEKIEDVFTTFKKQQQDVALLWRPHPLIVNTIKTMRPNILQRYLSLRADFIREGWGIYDDTSDMDKAIVLSDAYYGDYSSVIHLFEKTGKTVMIQNMYYKDSQNTANYALSSSGAVIYKDIMYLVSEYTNLLTAIDLKSQNIIESYHFPGEKYRNDLYWAFEIIGDEIWFAPYNAREVVVFNCINKKFNVIDNILTENEKKKDGKFAQIIYRNGSVYLLGENIHFIIKINTITKEVIKSDIYRKLLEEEGIPSIGYIKLSSSEYMTINNYVFALRCCADETYIYVPMRFINCILAFSLNLEEFRFISVNCSNISRGFSDIHIEKDTLVVYGDNDNRVSININNYVTNELQLGFISKSLKSYQRVVYTDEKEFYFCCVEGKIGIRKNQRERIEDLGFKYEEDYWAEPGKYSVFSFVAKWNDYILFQTRTGANIYKLNTKSLQTDRIISQFPEAKYEEIAMQQIKCGDEKLRENGFTNLDSFLKTAIFK